MRGTGRKPPTPVRPPHHLRRVVVKSGIDIELETQADALLFADRGVGGNQRDKQYILAIYQLRSRWSHEVYVTSGCPDSSLMRGLFRRSANSAQTHLNSRDGHLPPLRTRSPEDT